MLYQHIHDEHERIAIEQYNYWRKQGLTLKQMYEIMHLNYEYGHSSGDKLIRILAAVSRNL